MKWLFIIDPIDSLNYKTDSTFAIMKESCRQGINVYFCETKDIFFEKTIKCLSKIFIYKFELHTIGSSSILDLNDFDIIFMRKDPPYDLSFHYCTELLSLTTTLVVNSPQALRDFNEKLIILNFMNLIPKTIVTSSITQVKFFLKDHPNGIVFKSLSSYQGRSVALITEFNKKAKKILKIYTENYSYPLMIQEYLPEVIIGDKRILLLGGKIIGAVLREPKKNSFLANLGQGGIARKTIINEREIEIVNNLSNFLINNRLYFVGLDIIGNYLTEINITCPTGIVHINNLNNLILEKEIVKYFFQLIKIKRRSTSNI